MSASTTTAIDYTTRRVGSRSHAGRRIGRCPHCGRRGEHHPAGTFPDGKPRPAYYVHTGRAVAGMFWADEMCAVPADVTGPPA